MRDTPAARLRSDCRGSSSRKLALPAGRPEELCWPCLAFSPADLGDLPRPAWRCRRSPGRTRSGALRAGQAAGHLPGRGQRRAAALGRRGRGKSRPNRPDAAWTPWHAPAALLRGPRRVAAPPCGSRGAWLRAGEMGVRILSGKTQLFAAAILSPAGTFGYRQSPRGLKNRRRVSSSHPGKSRREKSLAWADGEPIIASSWTFGRI